MTPNARFQRLALLALAIALVLLPLAVFAAPTDDRGIAASDKIADGTKPRKPPVLVPDRRDLEVDSLLAEVRRLRAQVEMCQADDKVK